MRRSYFQMQINSGREYRGAVYGNKEIHPAW